MGLLIKNSNSVERLNKQLIDLYGVDTVTGDAIYRVAWSEYTEKRITRFTETGIELLHPQLIERRKYSYIHNKWVLENLVLVPEWQQYELAGAKISYEPLMPFERKGEAIMPSLQACQFIIDAIRSVSRKTNLAKYVEDDGNGLQAKLKEAAKLYEELFGNETDVTDALSTGSAVINPYQKESN